MNMQLLTWETDRQTDRGSGRQEDRQTDRVAGGKMDIQGDGLE